MNCINNYLLVEFTEDRLHIDLGGGLKLLKPDRYLFQDSTSDGEASKTVQVTDRRLVNPQICRVLAPNSRYNQLKAGDSLFVHYGAIEASESLKMDYIDCHFIDAGMVFFRIGEDGVIYPQPNIYIGEVVEVEAARTESGIYLTAQATIKQERRIRILFVPEDNDYEPGDVVVTVDDYQYELDFNGKKYIKLDERYIVGKVLQNG